MNPPSKCVVLVPVGGSIVPECDAALSELERRGYAVRRIRGYSQIDVARNEIVSYALADGYEETFWIDSDVVFHPDDVERLRGHDLPISCGIYPKKNRHEIAVHVMPGTKGIVFGEEGGLMEVLYAATGFMHVRRSVYESVQSALSLPVCNKAFGEQIVPFFQPLIVNRDSAPWYLGEDYAFCERVRQIGHRIMADTRIRLLHVGQYGFGWEDAGGSYTRNASYRFRME